MRVEITDGVIPSGEIVAGMKAGPDGAVCVFDGIVRDNSRGRKTLYLDYEAYREMALEQMHGLAAEAVTKFGVRDVALVHRLGRLMVGETRVLGGVFSAHRGAAFEACRGLMVGAGLLMQGAAMAQAPIVRKPPPQNGTQAPQTEDDTQVPPVAAGQQGSSQKDDSPKGGFPTIKVDTRLVNVALNVVDAKGSPVGGLVKDDFQILEDGKLQEIRIFERETTTPLSIVLAIDTSESVLTNERLEKEAAKHFVNALLREQDELDLMEFSDVVRELVPFTNQKKRIENGINNVQRGEATAVYDAGYLASQA